MLIRLTEMYCPEKQWTELGKVTIQTDNVTYISKTEDHDAPTYVHIVHGSGIQVREPEAEIWAMIEGSRRAKLIEYLGSEAMATPSQAGDDAIKDNEGLREALKRVFLSAGHAQAMRIAKKALEDAHPDGVRDPDSDPDFTPPS